MQRVVTNQHEDVSIFQPIRCKTQLTNYWYFLYRAYRQVKFTRRILYRKKGRGLYHITMQAFSQPINYNERHILAIFVRLYIDLEDVSTFLFVFICCYFRALRIMGKCTRHHLFFLQSILIGLLNCCDLAFLCHSCTITIANDENNSKHDSCWNWKHFTITLWNRGNQ